MKTNKDFENSVEFYKDLAEMLQAELKNSHDKYLELNIRVVVGTEEYSALVNEAQYLKLENEKFRKALGQIATQTYGTELCNSDEENNKILAEHFFWHQGIAKRALEK